MQPSYQKLIWMFLHEKSSLTSIIPPKKGSNDGLKNIVMVLKKNETKKLYPDHQYPYQT